MILDRPLKDYDLFPVVKFKFFEFDSLCNIQEDPPFFSL